MRSFACLTAIMSVLFFADIRDTSAFEAKFIVLPTLGGNVSYARGINNLGTIVGDAEKPPVGPFWPYHAFSYADGEITDLGALESYWDISWGYDINDAGVAVGCSLYCKNQSVGYAVRYRNGLVENLGTLGGDTSGAWAINNHGTIVGISNNAEWVLRAFIYSEESGSPSMVDLGGNPGNRTSAYAINNHGVVAGSFQLVPNSPYVEACIWPEVGSLVRLGYLADGTASEARAINDQGVVVGSSAVSGCSAPFHAFMWTPDGSMIDLGIMGEGESTYAYDINSSGMIVGERRGGALGGFTHAIFRNGLGEDWIDLQDTYFPDWQFSTATAINDNGWIVGHGMNAAGEVRGWLLIIPEPGTLEMLAAAGLAALMLLFRRRW